MKHLTTKKLFMTIETFKMIGSIHLLPHISVCYDSTFCENAISFGWLLWGFSIVRKNGMHL
jgi:hypothetical protein